MFLRGRSSQTNLSSLSVTMYLCQRRTYQSSLPQRTFVRRELTQSFTMDLRHRRTFSVFQKGPLSQTKLFNPLSQKTFVTDKLTLSSTNELRHRRIYSVFLKGPSSQANLLSLSQRTFDTDELTVSSTNDLDELTQSFANDLCLSLSQRTCVRNVMVSRCIFRQ